MRKSKVLVLTMAFLIIMSYTAFSGEIETEENNSLSIDQVEISIDYDSIFYKAKLLWEQIRLATKFSDIGKANLENRFALRRMAEAQLLIEKEKYELAQGLIQESSSYLMKAKGHVLDAVLKKDTDKGRTLLESVSQTQDALIGYLEDIDEKYSGTFDIEGILLDLKDSGSDISLFKAFLQYKDNLFEDHKISEAALLALQQALIADGGQDAEAIVSSAIDTIEESGSVLTQDEIDAITSATYDILEESGGSGGTGVDATTSASLTEAPGTMLEAGGSGVDATTSATIAGEPATPTDGTTVDAVTSATTTTGSSSLSDDDYEDDEHYDEREDDDDHYERDEDEEEHEDDDD